MHAYYQPGELPWKYRVRELALGQVWMGPSNERDGWDFRTPGEWWFRRYEPIEDEL